MEKQKIKEYKNKDKYGKYIPKNKTNINDLKTFIEEEDGVFVSKPSLLTNLNHNLLEKSQDKRKKGIETKSMHFANGNPYLIPKDLEKTEIKKIQLIDCTFPIQNLQNQSSLSLTIKEPLIIDEENQFIKSLNIILPKTFTKITNVTFPNNVGKSKSITITTEEKHYIPNYSDIYLIDKDHSIYSNYVYYVIESDENTLVCVPKLEKNSKIGFHNRLYISSTFNPNIIYIIPPLNRTEVSEMINKQIQYLKLKKNIYWDSNKSQYIVENELSAQSNNFTSVYLIEKELSAFRNPIKTIVPNFYSITNGEQLANVLQNALGMIEIDSKHYFSIYYKEEKIEFQLLDLLNSSLSNSTNNEIKMSNRFTPDGLMSFMAKSINSRMNWNEDIERMYAYYDVMKGVFTLSNYSHEIDIEFSKSLADILGFEIRLKGLKTIQSSPRFFPHGIDFQIQNPQNKYLVRYNQNSDTIQIYSKPNLHPIAIPFCIIDSPISRILSFEEKLDHVFESKSVNAALSFPETILLFITELDSNTISENPNDKCFGILKKVNSNYCLTLPFETKKDSIKKDVLQLTFAFEMEKGIKIKVEQNLFSIIEITKL